MSVFDCGAATRAHPLMEVNGDAVVLKQWRTGALVGVIDGLGHGELAYQAAQTAWQYVENHSDQPLPTLFAGVECVCRPTRGVVMALARLENASSSAAVWLTFASIGNIEAHLFGPPRPVHFMARRGVLGLYAPVPVLTEHAWEPGHVLVLHSDGVTTAWRWRDVARFAFAPATVMAQRMLRTLARDDDDATVVIVKGVRDGTARHQRE